MDTNRLLGHEWCMTEAEMPSLAERIADVYDTLSRQERQFADAVLPCIRDLAGYTATELAAQAKVSKATATRFFRRLGYSGFEEARLETRRGPYAGSPLEDLLSDQPARNGTQQIEAHLNTEARNIAETFGAISPADVTRAVELLMRARKVWIMGFRDSYPLAQYARVMLTRVLEQVTLLPGDGSSHAEDLIGIGPQDAMLAIGFRRQPRMFNSLLRLAQSRGVRVILLKEPDMQRKASPGVLTLRCSIRGTVFDSHAACLSVLNMLCSRVVRALGATGKQRLEMAEQFHRALNDLDYRLTRTRNTRGTT